MSSYVTLFKKQKTNPQGINESGAITLGMSLLKLTSKWSYQYAIVNLGLVNIILTGAFNANFHSPV